MSAVVRSLWVARVLATAPLVVFFGAAALYAPSAWTTAALLAAAAAGAVAATGTWVFTRELGRGDRGELLLKAGGRLPIGASRAARRTGRLEVGVDAVALALAAVGLVRSDGTGAALLVVGAAALSLSLLLEMQRTWTSALTESLVALMEGDLERAERALAPAERSRQPTIRAAVVSSRAQIELRRGRPEAALRLLESAWPGVLDDRAAVIGLGRLGRGDPDLAARWLETRRGDTRYDRYLDLLVTGRLALHRQEWDRAVAATRTPVDLPPWYQRQLALLEAAALQGAGRTAEAAATVDRAGGIAADGWMAASDPYHHQLLVDAVAGRPSSGGPRRAAASAAPSAAVSTSRDPFAAPASSRPGPSRWAREAGAIPVESMPLASYQTLLRRVVLTSTSLVTVALGALLLVLTAGLAALNVVPTRAYAGYAVVCIGSGALSLLGQAASLGRGIPAVALSDGRRVTERLFWAWAIATLGPLGAFGMLVLVAGLNVPGLAPMVAAALAVLGPLLGWVAYVRIQRMRLVWVAHFAPAASAGAQAAAISRSWAVRTGSGVQWVALARLWSGDAAGAETELDAGMVGSPWLDGLKGWFRAGRGELDLDRVLAEPDPTEPGDRYRWAVTLALAALRAGATERVRGRVGGWYRLADEVPNRFGGLLRHLAARVAGDPRVRDPDLEFLVGLWPFAA